MIPKSIVDIFFKRSFLTFLLLAAMGCTTAPTGDSQEDPNLAFFQDLATGNLLKARNDLTQSIRKNPRDPIPWNNLAYLDFRENHLRHAEGEIAQGLALDPRSLLLRMNKIRLELALGSYRDARKALLELSRDHPWPKRYRLLMAIADMHTGHPDSARILLLEILSQRPGDRLAELNLEKLQKDSWESYSSTGVRP